VIHRSPLAMTYHQEKNLPLEQGNRYDKRSLLSLAGRVNTFLKFFAKFSNPL
jgi:hypothetical protein